LLILILRALKMCFS